MSKYTQNIKFFFNSNLIFFLINFALFLQPSKSFILDETLINFIFTFSYIFILLIFQIIFIENTSKIITFSFYKNLMISLALAANFICIFLHVSNFYAGLSLIYKFSLVIPLIIFFLIFNWLINLNIKLKIVFRNMLIVTILFQIFQLYETMSKKKADQIVSIKDYNHYSKNINFKTKPKIFIFVMDALTPKKIVEKKLDYSPIYSEYLNQNFKSFNFVMTDFASTTSFLNSLLFLDSELWLKEEKRNNLFNGLQNSPLFEIFKNNGYKISTYTAASQYNARSNYIDFNPIKNYGNKFLNLYRPNYCNWIGSAFFLRYYGICYFYKFFSNKYHLGNFGLDFISKQEDNWLTISYFSYPSHVHAKINDEKSLKAYQKLFSKRDLIAKEILQDSFQTIKKNSENFIILVFGDHGLMTSNPNKFDIGENKYETIEDLYVISSHYYDNNKICNDIFNDYNLTSPTQIMRSLILCLSDKEKIFFTEKDLNKLFIREGYTKENVEIFKTIYFDRNKFIKSYESFYNR